MLARGEGQEASRRAGGLQPHGVMTVAIILTQLGRSFLFLTRRYCWLGAGILSVFTTLGALLAHSFRIFDESDRGRQTATFFEHISLMGGLAHSCSWASLLPRPFSAVYGEDS
jgi:transmembrane protein